MSKISAFRTSRISLLNIFSFSVFQLFSISPLAAILDTNTNGLSDVWECEHNNGSLFSPANTDHSPTADPDYDGWTNAQEAIAGTNPFAGSIPAGKTTLSITPSTQDSIYELTWSVIPGKSYRLQASSDLQTWFSVGSSIPAEANDTQLSLAVQATAPSAPASLPTVRLFWRIKVSDTDADNDSLSNAEELVLGLNPYAYSTLSPINDFWLATYYQNELLLSGPNSINFNADLDQDGISNSKEFLDGTDPNSAQSHIPIFYSIYRSGRYSWRQSENDSDGIRFTGASWIPGSGSYSEGEELTSAPTLGQLRQKVITDYPFLASPPSQMLANHYLLNYHYIEQLPITNDTEFALLDQSRTWMKLDKPVIQDTSFSYLNVTWEGEYNEGWILEPSLKAISKHEISCQKRQ